MCNTMTGMIIHFKAKAFKNIGLSIYVYRNWHCLFAIHHRPSIKAINIIRLVYDH